MSYCGRWKLADISMLRVKWREVIKYTEWEPTGYQEILDCFKVNGKQFWLLTNERPTWCHLLFYFTYYVLNMFRTLIYPSSGACDCVDELSHRSSCSQLVVCWSFCCGWYLVVLVLQASACKTNTTKYRSWRWIYYCPKHVEHISEIK